MSILKALACAGLSLAATCLSGCNGDSYIDPSKTGLFSNTATSMPVLSRLDVIERPDDVTVDFGPPRPAELYGEKQLEYVIAPGDALGITVMDIGYTGVAEEVQRVVTADGIVMLPEVGPVQAAGSTLPVFEDAVRDKILEKNLLQRKARPRVAVSLLQGRGMIFTIDGQVGKPDEYTLTSGDYKIRQALALAGGTPPTTKRILIMRAQNSFEEAAEESGANAGGQADPDSGTNGGSTGISGAGTGATPTQLPANPSTQARPMVPAPAPNIDDLIRGLEASEGGAPAGSTPPAAPAQVPPAQVPPAQVPPTGPLETPGLPASSPANPLDIPSHTPSSLPAGATGGNAAPPPIVPDEPAPGLVPDPPAPGAVATFPRGQDGSTGLTMPTAGDPAVPGSAADAYRYPSVELDNQPLDYKFDPESQRWNRVNRPDAPTPTVDDQSEDAGKNELGVATRVIEVDYEKLIRGNPGQNVVIRPNDYVYVEPPPIGVVYIGGEVLRPGVFQLPTAGELTLSRAVTAAGELGAIAIPDKVDLTRRIGTNREATIRVNLAAIRRRTEPDIVLKPDDHIIVGTDFWATPLAVIRNGFRATYGFGFVVDRNWGNDIFGPPPVDVTTN